MFFNILSLFEFKSGKLIYCEIKKIVLVDAIQNNSSINFNVIAFLKMNRNVWFLNLKEIYLDLIMMIMNILNENTFKEVFFAFVGWKKVHFWLEGWIKQ